MLQLGISGNKEKKKANPNLEFVSPYPLEDCVWQLQNFPGVGAWFPVRTQVELAQVDEETWAFELHKTYFSMGFLQSRRNSWDRSGAALILYFKLQANGYLKHTVSNTTSVIGHAQISNSTIVVNLLLLILTILLLIQFLLNFRVFETKDAVLLIVIASISISGMILISNRESYLRSLRSDIKGVVGN